MEQLIRMSTEVLKSTGYEEFFGPAKEIKELTIKMITVRYRKMAKVLHPDQYPEGLDDVTRAKAEEAFKRLVNYYNQATKAAKCDMYAKPTKLAMITTKRGQHEIRKAVGRGDIASTFIATSMVDNISSKSFIKMAKRSEDNDLIAAEITALKQIHQSPDEPIYGVFVSQMIDSFLVPNGSRCRAIAIPFFEGFYSLAQVCEAFPNGVLALDAIWMWRKILVALGFAHDQGVIHGAVLPQNIMIHPGFHGLILADWCYSSIQKDGNYQPIKAIVSSNRSWYPQEVIDKLPPSEATDIILAARTMTYVMGGEPVYGVLPDSVPRPIRAFFKGCLTKSQTARPQNAWLLLQEFDELLEEMGTPYYPRRFREFRMPAGI